MRQEPLLLFVRSCHPPTFCFCAQKPNRPTSIALVYDCMRHRSDRSNRAETKARQKSTCARSTEGRRGPHSLSTSQLTSPLDPITSPLQKSRYTKFNTTHDETASGAGAHGDH